MKDTCTIWVCQDCIMHHANGECGSCHTDEGHDREPMGLVDKPMSGYDMVTMGRAWEEHAEDCVFHGLSGPNISTPESECDCETMTFSWSSCEGCGSTLGGERHAMTLWFDDDDEDECPGHYDDDATLTSGAGIGEAAYCDGSCL